MLNHCMLSCSPHACFFPCSFLKVFGVNIIIITLICFWVAFLLLGNSNYNLIQIFFEGYFGKFIIICTIWSFTFQILSEIRHIFWDLGYGFELKTSKITGLLVIFGSIFLTILILAKDLIL